jgi:succinate dehydrogenase/fumarate reductase cytochrome b subunit
MAFKFIFWGFVFFLDIRIGGFDILPNIIGYILILRGLTELKNINDYFRKANGYTVILIFTSILNFILYFIQTLYNTAIIYVIIQLIITIAFLCLVFSICNGIKEMSDDLYIEKRATDSWKLFLASVILTIINTFVLSIIVSILVIILSIITLISMLRLFKEAEYCI